MYDADLGLLFGLMGGTPLVNLGGEAHSVSGLVGWCRHFPGSRSILDRKLDTHFSHVLLLAFGLNTLYLPRLWAPIEPNFGHKILVGRCDHTFYLGTFVFGGSLNAHSACGGRLDPGCYASLILGCHLPAEFSGRRICC